ncbi:GspH/FimT family pseudopilin [Onishia taeanensis]|uniref:GspH/FimT family pseudopilin n=1 Tax=Onishia taeanensis TaxID=284577 RepID=UPI000DD314B9|nr:GspH/FimT family pseudopilin [Halomonas taeanensis]
MLVKVSKGFTLIELLVTMAVAIIFATVAVPNFVDMINRQRFATEFNSVLIGLNLARSEAIKRRENVSYVVTEPGDTSDGTGWQWEVTFVNEDGDVVLLRQASGSGQIDLNVADDSTITFNSLGRRVACTLNPCRIALEGDGKPRYYGLEISTYGRIARLDTSPE